jgi:hypothetical protein
MASYYEQIAQWRQQREARQIADRMTQMSQEYAQVVRERDQAIANNDSETAEMRDYDAQQLEQEWLQYNPPRPRQMDPQAAAWLNKHRAFRERHGQAADQAIQSAHTYATRPRNPNATNPAHAGMGLKPNTRQYFEALDSLLELYAKDYGLHFDSSEVALTAPEAAKVSGITPQHYDNVQRAMGRRLPPKR